MYALIAAGVVCGGLCSYFSKKLFKAQLFVTAFLMVFISLPSYLSFMGKSGAAGLGVQYFIERRELKESYKEFLEKRKSLRLFQRKNGSAPRKQTKSETKWLTNKKTSKSISEQ